MRALLIILAISVLFMSSFTRADEPKSRSNVRIEQDQKFQAAQMQLLDQLRKQLELLENITTLSDEQEKRQKNLLKLVSEIEKRILQSKSGVRSHYLPAATTDPVSKAYYEKIVARVLDAGTKDFPKEGGNSLYGRTTILLTLSKSGKIESIEVLKASQETLANHSIQILKQLEPFEAFPKQIAENTDRLVIMLPLNYTNNEPSGTPVQP
jgi:outer membrane biosynthesis protein TonB